MAYRWPAGTIFKRIDLDVEERSCPVCARDMHVWGFLPKLFRLQTKRA